MEIFWHQNKNIQKVSSAEISARNDTSNEPTDRHLLGSLLKQVTAANQNTRKIIGRNFS